MLSDTRLMKFKTVKRRTYEYQNVKFLTLLQLTHLSTAFWHLPVASVKLTDLLPSSIYETLQ